MKIEGRNAVLEALKSGKDIDVILAEKGMRHEILALARERGVKVQFVDKFVLDKESVTKRHQGVVAKVSDFEYCEPEDILRAAAEKGKAPFLVLLDGVEDPHNLGSILRVCECAGVDGVILPKNRAVPVNETVIRCAAGATEYVKVARVTNLNQTIEFLQQQGVWVYCADMDGEDIYETDLTGSLALVIGGEGFGVKSLTRKKCDKAIALPICGKINSLNASVACGIAVYEALRQRRNK